MKSGHGQRLLMEFIFLRPAASKYAISFRFSQCVQRGDQHLPAAFTKINWTYMDASPESSLF